MDDILFLNSIYSISRSSPHALSASRHSSTSGRPGIFRTETRFSRPRATCRQISARWSNFLSSLEAIPSSSRGRYLCFDRSIDLLKSLVDWFWSSIELVQAWWGWTTPARWFRKWSRNYWRHGGRMLSTKSLSGWGCFQVFKFSIFLFIFILVSVILWAVVIFILSTQIISNNKLQYDCNFNLVNNQVPNRNYSYHLRTKDSLAVTSLHQTDDSNFQQMSIYNHTTTSIFIN